VGIRDYLLARSAILIEANEVQLLQGGADRCGVLIKDRKFQHGVAAAIDRRGYFLTAAHCVQTGPVWLLFPSRRKMQAFRSRVVWRGDESRGQPDLAILHVPARLENVFAWATDFDGGEAAAALGVNSDNRHTIATQCMAGRLLSVTGQARSGGADHQLIWHDVPLRHGDSGGPLASMNGRLLGINVAGFLGLKWKRLSIEPLCWHAHRPDPAGVQSIIEQDVSVRNRPHKTSPQDRGAF
jgi:hypothetical protein